MKKLNNPIFYITNDPERAVGLEKILPNYHIICIDHTTIVDQLEKENHNIFCLEKALNKRNPMYRNSNRLLKHPLTLKYIKKNIKTGQTPYIQVFKIAPNIERTAEKHGFKILNTPSELNRKFENKIPQFKHLKDLNLFPPTKILQLKEFNFKQLQEKLGKNLVLQFNRGHTGESTIFLENQQHYKKIQNKFPKRTVRISKFIHGDAWTINACETKYGTIYGGLSYQITGVPECTSQKGGTVGNDWSVSQNLPNTVLDQLNSMIPTIGETLAKHHYKGMFGLDLIIDSNKKVWLIEINAREPASTSMHTQLLLSQKMIPLNLFHILEFLYPQEDYLSKLKNNDFINLSPITPQIIHTGSTSEKTAENTTTHSKKTNFKNLINFYNNKALKPIKAAQIFIRNNKSQTVTLQDKIKSGLYKHDLKLVQDNYSIPDKNRSEQLIFSFNKGHKIKSNYEMARIQTSEGVVNTDKNLYNKYLELIRKIKNKLCR